MTTSTKTARSITTAVTVSTNLDEAAALRVSPSAVCSSVGLITATGLEARQICTSQIASL